MKREIPEAFKEHMKHKKEDMPMEKDKKEPDKTGRGFAKDFTHGHTRHKKPRGS